MVTRTNGSQLPVAAVGTGREKLQTEFEFTLPRGYVDSQGLVHKRGLMRLATALDEVAPLRDPRVRANQAYITFIVMARVIVRLGSLSDVNTGVIEGMFTADMAYLQDFYQQINNHGHALVQTTCPVCEAKIEVDLGNGLSQNTSEGGTSNIVGE